MLSMEQWSTDFLYILEGIKLYPGGHQIIRTRKVVQLCFSWTTFLFSFFQSVLVDSVAV